MAVTNWFFMGSCKVDPAVAEAGGANTSQPGSIKNVGSAPTSLSEAVPG